MEKKYYFRGLGLGIVVTAIIMGIALPHGTKTREMTDDEVIARAKELGMTEDTRLLEPTEEDSDGEDAVSSETPVKKDAAVKTETDDEKQDGTEAAPSSDAEAADGTEQKPTVDTPEPAETEASAASSERKTGTDTNEMRKQDDDGDSTPVETAGDSDTNAVAAGLKSITVVSGDGSYTVAQKLEQAGAVSSASSFDTYLCEHGYDKKLRTGTFQIPTGATDEQIARIVTGQQ